MQFPQLRMESQFAKISIQQTPTQMEMTQPKADMQLEQPKADMNITTTKGKLTIDQSKAWAEANLKSALRWTEDYAQEGKRHATEGTARRAEQGAELIDIHLDQNVIADQAIQNGSNPLKTPNVTYIPSPFSVQIHYEPGDVDINAHANKPVMDVQIRRPEISAHRGNVAIAMERYADLKIDVAYN